MGTTVGAIVEPGVSGTKGCLRRIGALMSSKSSQARFRAQALLHRPVYFVRWRFMSDWTIVSTRKVATAGAKRNLDPQSRRIVPHSDICAMQVRDGRHQREPQTMPRRGAALLKPEES